MSGTDPLVEELSERILVEHDGLIVMDKPAGVPTAGDSLEQPGSLQYALMKHYRRMIWAVHQIDRDTTGLNLFVRRKALVAQWTEHLAAGTKDYLALCEGSYDGGEVQAPLGWVGQGIRGVTSEGKAAHTSFEALQRTERATLVRATLHTGRTHQIRIHLSHVGHPVVGDERYGATPHETGGHLLHAWRVDVAGQRYEAPLPASFRAAAERFGFDLGGLNDRGH